MNTPVHAPADPAPPTAPFTAWLAAAEAQRKQARRVARLVADTLAVQFPGAAYLTLYVEDENPRDWHLLLQDVRDGVGAVLFDFRVGAQMPDLGPEHDELRSSWGDLDCANDTDLRAVVRLLYIAGAVYDRLPVDLDDSSEDEEVLCMLLSAEARPYEWCQYPDRWGVEERRLRPYCAAGPEADIGGTAGSTTGVS